MFYKVISMVSERELTVIADSSYHAKKTACKEWGINPNDKWCGISVLKAYRLKTEGGKKE